MHRLLVSIVAALAAAVMAAILLVPVSASAQDKTTGKNPYVADCKGQESTLAMAQKATRAIKLDLSACTDLASDDKSRCEKTIRDAYTAVLQSAQNAEKAAKRAIACCQKPGSKACGKKAAKKR